ncbi:UDP-N-acetylmuramoyl-L-alanine--D-glutamate ligase [Sulfurovum sp. ST-21]|uniref:UDP-N-acetylmuramoylalanine--D-glutamate ligase n=1 Tax=Sulfurovum indicum TaxID=2779528 RepID=A0A7M1S718_9BACT|nr:UDP-N-acetylmuramoyl-L-alanine--D-glutamate ligase [Sulfurovum indicum]QOR62150.1 UDP-N-acetylmuramoyl-L-alanine--D-glutamate ligase [Sulfurovum indicum]
MKPTLFGYGLTTKAIAKKLGGGCTFFDDNCKETYTDEYNNIIKPSSLFNPDESRLEVTTPSLPPKHPLIQKAKHLLSEYDYFLGGENNANHNSYFLLPTSSFKRKTPFTIWISGTNGKTTTTQMLTHLLKKRGAVSGGNIGTPLAELDEKAPVWVLETSSFTLHHTKIASPDIYLLLPVTPDHLDWHSTPQAYEADKLKPLLNMKEGELALIPKGMNLPRTDAYVVEYDSNNFLCDYFGLNAANLNYKGAFLQDALLSLSITKVLFDETDYDLLNTFQRDAHRQEELTDRKGRLWVNDSKATNLDATIQAVKTYSDNHIHLILGGDDKGVDLTPLFSLLAHIDLTLYSIGANSQKVKKLSKKFNIDLKEAVTLEHAVKLIDTIHTQKSIALLSPAAASFDQFTSYKHRGERFVKLVKSL